MHAIFLHTQTARCKKSSASLGCLQSSHVLPVLLAIWETEISLTNSYWKWTKDPIFAPLNYPFIITKHANARHTVKL